MKPMFWTRLGALFFLAVVSACGGRHNKDNGTGGPTGDDVTCETNAECNPGEFCQGGVCGAGDACTAHADCDGTSYCHFVNAPDPWVANSPGVCDAPCTTNESCGVLGQQCVNGRCYTNVTCNPTNQSRDCPPGEVCNKQLKLCGAPPTQCNFDTDCPSEWVCLNRSCIDPDDANLGSCTTTASCSSVAGCQSGNCTCDNGSCKPNSGSCSNDAQCGASQRCSGGMCQNTASCSNQSACTPYGLVCSGGYCKNPTPCGTGNTCQNGYVCKTNFTPPACFPPGTPDCTRDEQCPTGQFCEEFSGTCKAGCRNNTDCVGGCGGSVPCNCNAQGVCGGGTSGTGQACTDNGQCTTGTVCAFNDPDGFLNCGLLGGAAGGDCSQSCHVACDMLMELITPSCPAGYTCGSGNGDTDALIIMLLGALLGGGEGGTGSVCYSAN